MNIHDPQWREDSRYHRGLAAEIKAREPRRLAHPHGTPRHPRTRAKAMRKTFHNHVRIFCRHEGADREVMSRLLSSGYYDEYRKAFADAED